MPNRLPTTPWGCRQHLQTLLYLLVSAFATKTLPSSAVRGLSCNRCHASRVSVNIRTNYTVLHALFTTISLQLTSTVYFRKQSNGSIFSFDNRDGSETELAGSDAAARFVGLAIRHSYADAPGDAEHERVYWSDHRSIRSAALNGSSVQTEIGAIARVKWIGVNFGASKGEVVELAVQGTRCVSVIHWSPELVECLVALPARYPLVDAAAVLVAPEGCSIRTTRGVMRGFVRNAAEMRAAGYPSPIVERIDIEAAFVLPHALVIHKDDLFWSNLADGKIYRSSLVDTTIQVLEERVWSVRGLAVREIAPTIDRPCQWELWYSLESKGEMRRVIIAIPSKQVPAASYEVLHRETILSGLHSPRGLAIDPSASYVYFTEKTGRIFRLALEGIEPAQVELTLDPSSTSTSIASRQSQHQPEAFLRLATIARLDGLAVNSRYVYWCESNTNVIARASVESFEREILLGGTPNSFLSWPRGIALRRTAHNEGQDFVFSEYTGRISTGAVQSVVVNEVTSSNMRYLDELIQHESSTNSDGHIQFYALE